MRNVQVQLKKKQKDGSKKVLVPRLTFTAKGGRITALMGPSGAGKTTLLNGISGMAPYAHVSGSLSLGGSRLHKSHMGYVPQFDALSPGFTIRETLMFSLRLRVRAVALWRRGSFPLNHTLR